MRSNPAAALAACFPLILAWLGGCARPSSARPVGPGSPPAVVSGLVMPGPAWDELQEAETASGDLAWLAGRNDRLLGSDPSLPSMLSERVEILSREHLWLTGGRAHESSRTTMRTFRRGRVR